MAMARAALMLVSSRDWMSQPASVRSRSMVWRARSSAVMGVAGKGDYSAGGPFRWESESAIEDKKIADAIL
jgi:hypothetical protein